MKKEDTTTQLFGLDLFSKSQEELLIVLLDHLQHSKKLAYIFTPNPEQVVQANADSRFFEALRKAEYLIPDGVGLVWASRVLEKKTGQPRLTERIAGVDVVRVLLDLARQRGERVLVLGGREYALSKQQNSSRALQEHSNGNQGNNKPVLLSEQYPELELGECYWLEGFAHAAKPTQAEQEAVARALKQLKPAIVFVALGAPAQELWLDGQRALLDQAGVRIGMAVGGSFDYLLGKVARAPEPLQRAGLEWAYRLWQEPWRWRRQLRLFQFIGMVGKKLLL